MFAADPASSWAASCSPALSPLSSIRRIVASSTGERVMKA
jgi:hypothetical protein